MAKSKIFSLFVLLVVLLGAMYFVYSYDKNSYSENKVYESSSSEVSYLEVEGKRAVSDNVVLIHDKFVGKYDKDARLLVLDSNGNAYDVKSGVVLVDSTLINANEESHSVLRLDNKRKSLSSN